MHLDNLGISYETVASEMAQDERARNLNNFTNPNSGVEVLLITSKIGSVSLNLQCASLLIVVDMFNAFYIFNQTQGRVERIGQLGEAEVHITWMDNTYDQIA